MDTFLWIPALFILLEVTNVLALYFKPGTKLANGVGVFKAWETSKADPEVHAFVRYLVYWVAGTKLIFLGLLTAILLYGAPELQRIALVVLVVAIATFYLRLFPLIRGMDREGQIDPPGYSRILGILIALFILALGSTAYFFPTNL